MRLKEIRLAGFKSFVDPTQVVFPGDLVAILGPNGCGKSNIIDAVRWVMGESSAKQLRGDAMTDVIFNGSAQRKPVGQASIELVFDNSSGRLQGQYGQYAEISVRRLVSRDGDSQYFLNGSRCRKRDIQDLFAGTGLGPRSYAIIEQGTISRLVESKPHELRVFLEEAAGIAKYKERRRETELRLAHSQENLNRLSDLRQELEVRLEQLSTQAEQARKFKALREQERITRLQLESLRWHQQRQQLERLQPDIARCQTQLDALQQQLLQTDIERVLARQQLTEQQAQLEHHQADYYQIAAVIARDEQQLASQVQAQARLQQDLAETERQQAEQHQQQEQDQQGCQQLEQAQQQLEPELAAIQREEQQLQQQFEVAHRLWQDWLSQRQQSLLERQRLQGSQNLLKSQLEQTSRQLLRAEQALHQLELQLQRGSVASLMAEETALQEQLELDRIAQLEAETALVQAEQQGLHQRQQLQQLRAQESEARATLARLQGQHSALRLMQSAAELPSRQAWLAEQGLSEPALAASLLKVPEPWLNAVDALLTLRLQAPLTSGFPQALPGIPLCLLNAEWTGEVADSPDWPWLWQVLQAPDGWWPWLYGIKAAPDDAAARQAQPGLEAGESVLSPSGLWLGPNWWQYCQPSTEAPGLLALARQQQQLTQQLEELEPQQQQYQQRLLAAEQHQQLLDRQSEQARQAVLKSQTAQREQQTELGLLQQRLRQEAQRQQELNGQREQQRDTQQQLQEERELLRLELDQEQQRLQRLDSELMQHESEAGAEQSARQAEQDLQQCRARLQQGRLQQARLDSQLQAARSAQSRAEQQALRLTQRAQALQAELAQIEPERRLRQQQLQTRLEQRLQAERQLGQGRDALTQADNQSRALEQQWLQQQQELQQQQAELDRLNLAQAACQLKLDHASQQLQPAGVAPLPWQQLEQLRETDLQQAQQQLQRQITRLGDINLTAIDEYDQQKQRKDYLDRQNQDLTDALATLTDAIRKIDKETRQKFQQTFEQVNQGLQRLFPTIFGGGEAWLELTDADLLETGVRIMARPPGKRNSSIQLLSGGEKALTAMALVFAIFELNPAPFCMLDEVDAPLDDLNVGRFCQLVQSMTDRVQFIYITHNKVAMEMARQLIGVTMQEPGVSRLVSVDIEQAIQLAAN